MLKVRIKVSNDLSFEIEGKDHKEIFEQISGISDVFSNDKCGRCGGLAKFNTREVDSNKFYEARCTNPKCRAKLSFGSHKSGGTLFPKRSADDGKYHQFQGWKIYDREQNKEI